MNSILIRVLQALLHDPIRQHEYPHNKHELNHLEEHFPDDDDFWTKIARAIVQHRGTVSHEHKRECEADLWRVQLSPEFSRTTLLSLKSRFRSSQLESRPGDECKLGGRIKFNVQIIPPSLKVSSLETVIRHYHFPDFFEKESGSPGDKEPV